MKPGKGYQGPASPPINPPRVHKSQRKYTVTLHMRTGLQFDIQCDKFSRVSKINALSGQESISFSWDNPDADYFFDIGDIILVVKRLNPGWTEDDDPQTPST